MDKKQFLFSYHLNRRRDVGWGNMALVSAFSEKEARQILDERVTYTYTDALACEIIHPDNIECLNLE
jgi:hypothetical protein